MSRMRITKIALACVCLIVIALPVLGQQKAAGNTGILGRLDPGTGSFTPVPLAAAGDTAAVTPVERSGKVVFIFNITIDSTIPTTSVISCNAAVSVADNISAAYRSIDEYETVVATRTGSTAKCTVTIPYSWELVTPTTDTLGRGFTISATLTSTTGGTVVLRTSSQSIPTITVPANGVTTTDTLAITL